MIVGGDLPAEGHHRSHEPEWSSPVVGWLGEEKDIPIPDLGFNSKMIHAGAVEDAFGSAVTPIYQTSTFAFKRADDAADRFAGRGDGFVYTRLGNPTVRALERCVAELEGGNGAVAIASGMAAVTTAFLTLLSQGDHVVSTAAVYGPSRTQLEKQLFRFGVDVVLHSVTKFINGHADTVGGILIASDPSLVKRLRGMMTLTGCNMDPHQAFLVHRGVKTLSLRIRYAQQTALCIARWLESRDDVRWVRYVGLPSHPQYELARQQMSGPGSMISFELQGGLEAGKNLMDRVRLAISLGGVESLIKHPASMTHAGVPRSERESAGISDGLVRYSAGIEYAGDLIEDLRQALDNDGCERPQREETYETRLVAHSPT